MSRRFFEQQSCDLSLVTPAIIQGRFRSSKYPGTAIFADNCRELAHAYRLSRGGPKLQPAARLFGAVERYTHILNQLRHARYKVVPYLIDMAQRSDEWLRAPEDFRPRTTHGRDQLPELIRYLFESYRVPAWMRAALAPRRGRPGRAPAFGWYVHVAQGKNLRSAPALPLPLSRKAAHEALRAPARHEPEQALLYGYLQANAAPPAVRDQLLQLSLWNQLPLDPPSLKLYEKLARTPAVLPEQVRPLLEYAQARRAEGASLDISVPAMLRAIERREAERREALVRQQAAHYGAQFDEHWPSHLPASPLEGACEHGQFTLRELRSLRELFEEGQHMQHCVFTYAAAARAGTASIWSLRFSRAGRDVGRVTVRVTPGERTLVEARRRCNRAIHPHERELLQSWAKSEGLSVVLAP
jgi:hypothetical protein